MKSTIFIKLLHLPDSESYEMQECAWKKKGWNFNEFLSLSETHIHTTKLHTKYFTQSFFFQGKINITRCTRMRLVFKQWLLIVQFWFQYKPKKNLLKTWIFLHIKVSIFWAQESEWIRSKNYGRDKRNILCESCLYQYQIYTKVFSKDS